MSDRARDVEQGALLPFGTVHHDLGRDTAARRGISALARERRQAARFTAERTKDAAERAGVDQSGALAYAVRDLRKEMCMLLDVFTILSISRVNKYFHALVSAKQLWISVVRDLSWRYLIDRPAEDNLTKLPTSALIQQFWTGRSTSVENLPPQSRVELLPEGRHILFYTNGGASPGGVECWEIHSGQRVWSWTSKDYRVANATFDFRRGGAEAVVSLQSFVDTYTIILEADLKTGESRTLLHLPIAGVFSRNGTLVSGDLFLCRVRTSGQPYILANWRTAELILFESSNVPNFILFSGYMALSFRKASTPGDHVRILATASLGRLWKPLSVFTLSDYTDPSDIPHIPVNVHGIGRGLDSEKVRIYAAKSPVHDEGYELVVEGSHRPTRTQPTNTLTASTTISISRYLLTLPSSAPPVLQLKSSVSCRKSFGNLAIRCQYRFSAGRSASTMRAECQVRDLTEAVDGRPRTLPIPPEAEALPSLPQLSNTGAIMFY
ncbi:hypothetical protein FB451DRAFT_1363006, partial [Mycena latifolia]